MAVLFLAFVVVLVSRWHPLKSDPWRYSNPFKNCIVDLAATAQGWR